MAVRLGTECGAPVAAATVAVCALAAVCAEIGGGVRCTSVAEEKEKEQVRCATLRQALERGVLRRRHCEEEDDGGEGEK